jgi:sterol desaturase/sphingolipid hydroxylase (fatty acid hydroxylase superfamily)
MSGPERFALIAGAFLFLVLIERVLPDRPFAGWRRWRFNVSVGVGNGLIGVLLAPLVAVWVTKSDFGLFQMFEAPLWLEIGLSLVLLDLAIYVQHRLFHQVPLLWRLHRFHHLDGAIDVTTGVRFHPGEIIVSLVYKTMVILILGPPWIAVMVFELVLTLGSIWQHADIRLPSSVDRRIRKIWVTPAMHLVHHTAEIADTDTNYGFCLSFWDRLFRSYKAVPSRQHIGIPQGL